MFGQMYYSVIEKKKWNGIRYNRMRGGMFHAGTDAWVFGSSVWLDSDSEGEYNFEDTETAIKYLETFELDEEHRDHSRLSPRTSISIEEITIRRRV